MKARVDWCGYSLRWAFFFTWYCSNSHLTQIVKTKGVETKTKSRFGRWEQYDKPLAGSRSVFFPGSPEAGERAEFNWRKGRTKTELDREIPFLRREGKPANSWKELEGKTSEWGMQYYGSDRNIWNIEEVHENTDRYYWWPMCRLCAPTLRMRGGLRIQYYGGLILRRMNGETLGEELKWASGTGARISKLWRLRREVLTREEPAESSFFRWISERWGQGELKHVTRCMFGEKLCKCKKIDKRKLKSSTKTSIKAAFRTINIIVAPYPSRCWQYEKGWWKMWAQTKQWE